MAFWSNKNGKNTLAARNKNGIAFLISWLFAFVLWLLTSLNSERTMVTKISYAFENVPHHIQIQEPLAPLNITVQGQGLELFRFLRRHKRLSMKIDYQLIQNSKWVPQMKNLSRDLGFNDKVRLIAVEPEAINVSSKKLFFKKLPILVSNQIEYEEGYDSISPAVLSKDSVIIYAHEPLPYSLSYIATEPLKLRKVDQTFQRSLRLKAPNLKGSRLSFDQIDYRLEVDRIISNEIEISVQPIGFPKKTILIPATVKVRYLVAARDFEDVQPGDFKAFVRASDSENQPFLVPELRVLNGLVRDSEVFPKTIDYLQP